MHALEARPDLVSRTQRITAATLAEQLTSREPPLVLDVRAVKEWEEKRIEGSLNMPLSSLRERFHELPRGKKLAAHCAGGYRSSIAASLLQQQGVTDMVDLIRGLSAWEAVKLKIIAT